MWVTNEFVDLAFKADPNDPQIFEKLRIASLLCGYQNDYAKGLKDIEDLQSYSDFEDRVRKLVKATFVKRRKDIMIKFSDEELNFLSKQKPAILASRNIDYTQEQLDKLLKKGKEDLIFMLSSSIFIDRLFDKKYFDLIVKRFGIVSLFELYPGVRLPIEYQKEYADSVLSGCIQQNILLDDEIQWQLFCRENHDLSEDRRKNYDFNTFNVSFVNNTNDIIKYLARYNGNVVKKYIKKHESEIPFYVLNVMKGEKFSKTILDSI